MTTHGLKVQAEQVASLNRTEMKRQSDKQQQARLTGLKDVSRANSALDSVLIRKLGHEEAFIRKPEILGETRDCLQMDAHFVHCLLSQGK